jgi:hypothetical protein
MATTLTTSAPRKAAPAVPILSAGRIRRLGPALERAPLFRDRIRHRPGPRSLSRRRSRPRRARRMAGLRRVDRPGVPPTRPAPPPSTARSRSPIWRRCCGWRASIGATCEAAPPAASSPSHIRVIDDTKDDVPLDEFAATDLLVSVDTIAAHCAGALGHKPVFCWFPFLPIGAGVSLPPKPLVPHRRVFRQEAARDWRKPLGKVAKALLRSAERRRVEMDQRPAVCPCIFRDAVRRVSVSAHTDCNRIPAAQEFY